MSIVPLLVALAGPGLGQPVQPVPTPGFSVEALADRAAPPASLADARERAAESDSLRAAFTLDPAAAWRTLSDGEAETLHRALGPDRPLSDADLTWFMRSAAVRVAGDDLAGLYNPLADVWLLLRFARSGGVLRVADAALVAGDVLRPRAEAASWTSSAGLYGVALAEADSRAAARFAVLPAVASSDLLFNALTERREEQRGRALSAIRRWVASLSPWGSNQARGDAWRALHPDLSEGGPGAGAAARLPMAVRASLAPAAAIEGPDGPSLLLVSPLYPSLYVTADYDPALSRPQLAILNLANAPLPADLAGGEIP
jgi:hypothetical protein